MAITRTPIVDDDGTGTTGTVIDNAWKQQLYDQIDAQVGAGASGFGLWTPVDQSGAGLTLGLSTTDTFWVKLGTCVFVTMNLTWPTTANASPAAWNGWPFTPTRQAAGAVGYFNSSIPELRALLQQGNKLGLFGANGAAVTNATMSTKQIVISVLFTVS